MARISNYKQDTELTANDRLVGSSYEGDGQTGPIYKTRTYTLGELDAYFSLNEEESITVTENSEAIAKAKLDIGAITDELSAISFFLVDLSSSFTSYDPALGGAITSVSESFANLVIQTTTSDRFATSQYVLDLFSSIATIDPSTGAVTSVSNAFITQVIETLATDGFASTQFVTTLGSNFGTYDADGNLLTLSQSFADLVLTTANTSDFASATFATNLASSLGTYNADGTITALSESFATLMLNTTAMDDKAESSYVLNLAGSIGTFDANGNLQSYSTSFINNIASLVNTGSYALASDLTQLQSEIGTFDANGNLLTVDNAFATQLLQTTAGQGLAEATFVNNLGSSIGTYDINGNLTAVSNAFATSVLSTTAGQDKASVSYVDDRVAAIGTYDTNTNTFSSFNAGFISDVSATVNTSGFAIATDVNNQFSEIAVFDGNGNFSSFSVAAALEITSTISSETQSEVDYLNNLTAAVGAVRVGNDVDFDPTAIQSEASVSTIYTLLTNDSVVSGAVEGGVDVTLTAPNNDIVVGQHVEIVSVPNGVPYMADQYSRVASIISSTEIKLTDGMYIPDGATIRFRGATMIDVTVSSGAIREGYLVRSTSDSHTDIIGNYVTAVNGNTILFAKAELFTQGEVLQFLGVYAGITETANAIANIDGTFRSSYGLQVDGNGNVTGMRFLADSTGTEIVFNTDSFKVVNSAAGTTSVAPFEIVTGGDNPGLNLNIPLNGVSGSFSGDISASSGTFGGVTIDSNGLSFGTVTIDSTGISSSTFNLDAATGNATFSGTLNGANITGATGNFTGTLNGANITGATGTFSDTIRIGAGLSQITIDNNGLRTGSGSFSINSDGTADFSGNIDVGGITINGQGMDFSNVTASTTLPFVWRNSDNSIVASISGAFLDVLPSLYIRSDERVYLETDLFRIDTKDTWEVYSVDARWRFTDDFHFSNDSPYNQESVYQIVDANLFKISVDTYFEEAINTVTGQPIGRQGGYISLEAKEYDQLLPENKITLITGLGNTYEAGTQHKFDISGDRGVYYFNFGGVSDGTFEVGNSIHYPSDFRATSNTFYFNLDGSSVTSGFNIRNTANTVVFEVKDNGRTRVQDLLIQGTLTNNSDASLKENIIDLNKPINVNWKQFNMKDNPDQIRYGVVAQDLEVEHPEFVSENEGIKAVNYIDLLVAKIAELESRIKELESKQNI